MCTYMQLCVMCVYEYLPLAEAARLGQASTAMRTVNNISTTKLSMELCTVLCCHAGKSVYFLCKTKMEDGRFLVFRCTLLG